MLFITQYNRHYVNQKSSQLNPESFFYILLISLTFLKIDAHQANSLYFLLY